MTFTGATDTKQESETIKRNVVPTLGVIEW
jgi:hypothetical protein